MSKLQTFVKFDSGRKQFTQTKKKNIENINDCPKLSLNNLRQLTLGVYQLNQAPYYTGEHMAENYLWTIPVN